jgi:hypothetical protein
MAGTITNFGERMFLQAVIDSIGPLTMHLSKFPFVVSDVMQLSDFIEATFDGYEPITLTLVGLESGSPGGKAVADFEDCVFTVAMPMMAILPAVTYPRDMSKSPPRTVRSIIPDLIYGYLIQDETGNIIACERFAGQARPMQEGGQMVTVPFSIRLWSPV